MAINSLNTVRSVADEVLSDLGFSDTTNMATIVQNVTDNSISVTNVSSEESTSVIDVNAQEVEEHVEESLLLPENHIITQDITTQRFKDADWFEAVEETCVTVGGVGGIGSYVAYLLAKLSPRRLVIYDPDTVELVNLAGQLYSKRQVGSNKTSAIYSTISDYCDYFGVYSMHRPFTETSNVTPIMIGGFDNMTARKDFFNAWLHYVDASDEEGRKKCLLIDGRLAAEEFQVYCIKGDDPENINRYMKECLFSDNQAEETPCSYKQTAFCATMIGSIIVNLFVNFICNTINIPRDLPFKTYYNANVLYLNTEY